MDKLLVTRGVSHISRIDFGDASQRYVKENNLSG